LPVYDPKAMSEIIASKRSRLGVSRFAPKSSDEPVVAKSKPAAIDPAILLIQIHFLLVRLA